MKNRRSIYRISMLALLVRLMVQPLSGQLSSPGEPVGDYSLLKAADMIYMLPPLHPLEVEASMEPVQESYHKSRHFAIERTVSISPLSHGVWSQEEGLRVWRAHLISPGAYSLGLVFDSYHLEEGVKLMIYDPDMEHIKGAYTSQNNKSSGVFAVGHIPGEEVIVELQVPSGMEEYGDLFLGSLSHAFLPVAIAGTKDGRYGRSQDCEIDINCGEGDYWQLEKKSVLRIQNLHINQYCTGVLMNNSAYDGDPLILTAKHCIETNAGAESTIFSFNYESPDCFGEDGSTEMSISGSELLSAGDSIDFSLVRLSLAPPDSFDVYYAGWDLTDSPGAPGTAIHHPEGDVKKISRDFDAPEATASKEQLPTQFWDHLPDAFWWIRQWDIGSTEPGSSGSPLYSPDYKVIGVLSFGEAKCGDSIGYDPQTDRVEYSKTVNVNDFYTRLGVAWDHNPDSAKSLSFWLDPTSSGVSSLDGLYADTIPEKPEEPEEPEEGEEMFRIYPNPAGNTIFMSAQPLRQGSFTYKIYDLRGTFLLGGDGDLSVPLQVDIRELQSGLFILLLEAEQENEVHKIVRCP